MNVFVSLIVNNAGKYTAGITKKTQREETVDANVTINQTHSFFEGQTVVEEEKNETRKYSTSQTEIQWSTMLIRKADSDRFQDETTSRFLEVQNKKKASKWKSWESAKESYKNYNFNSQTSRWDSTSYLNQNKGFPYQPSLFENEDSWTIPKKEEKPVDISEDQMITLADSIDWDRLDINNIVAKIMMGTPLARGTNFVLKDFGKHYANACKKNFSSITYYDDWITSYIEFLFTTYIDLTSVVSQCKEFEVLDDEIIINSIAYKVKEILSALPESEYKNCLLGTLDLYIYG